LGVSLRPHLLIVLHLLCAALAAQWDPLHPPSVRAPDTLRLHGEVAFGYDTNVRLRDQKRVGSTFLDGETGAEGAIDLGDGRLFGTLDARGRWPLSDPEAATWHIGVRGGGRVELYKELFTLTGDLGAEYRRRWVYEIFGPQTHDDKTRRAIYDARLEVSVRPKSIEFEMRLWAGFHDFSEDAEGRYWDTPSAQDEETDPLPRPRSLDFWRGGAWAWLAGSPTKGVSVGPYFWIDRTLFTDQRRIEGGQPQSRRLDLVRFQFGSRLLVCSEHADFESGWHWREQGGAARTSGLGYTQYGWSADVTFKAAGFSFRAGLDVWWRTYYFGVSYKAVPPDPPGSFGGGAPSFTSTEEFGLRAIVAVAYAPAEWLKISIQYRSDTWDDEIPDLGYRQHEFSLAVALCW
jgi:hypothetical protein